MDLIDTAILNILRDGKPREFQQILDSKFSPTPWGITSTHW